LKAVYLTSHGKPDSLTVGFFDDPTPASGEIVVRMATASVNHVDLYMRDSGVGIRHSLPLVMGVDGAGTVEDCNGQQEWKRGDRVVIFPAVYCGRCRQCVAGEQILCDTVGFLGENRHGTFGEYVAIPSANLFRAPDALKLSEIAAVPVAYLTAWRMLFSKGGLGPGQKVLIFGIGGGVSLAALQLAKLAGADVAVTSTSLGKRQRALDYGADYAWSTDDDVVAEVMRWTGRSGVDLVIDNVGKATWGKGLRSLKKGGSIVCCGATSGGDPPADLQRLFVRQIAVMGSSLANPSDFDRLLAVIASGRLRPVIDRSFALDEVVDALARIENREQFGKVTLRISESE